MAIVDYKAVSIFHAEMEILSGVDLAVNPGEFIYLCGRVGSGKSTLLKTMYAELPVIAGEARMFDKYDMMHLKKRDIPMLRRQIGIVFQDFKLLIDRSVHDNLEFVLRATGWRQKKAIEERIQFVLDTVGMSNKGYKWPHQLSGGEQQRIVIARALLNLPQLIIADEPTGNLDPETAHGIMDLLEEISKSGTAIVMATHNMQLVQEYPHTRYFCADGKLTSCSTSYLA